MMDTSSTWRGQRPDNKVGCECLRLSCTSAISLSAQYPMSPTLSFFEPYPRSDADDGKVDGVVSVQYGPSPIYVETQP